MPCSMAKRYGLKAAILRWRSVALDALLVMNGQYLSKPWSAHRRNSAPSAKHRASCLSGRRGLAGVVTEEVTVPGEPRRILEDKLKSIKAILTSKKGGKTCLTDLVEVEVVVLV